MGVSIKREGSEMLQQALDKLDEQQVLLDGHLVKPSTCYRLSLEPPHVLYNTNCPMDLMEKVEAILSQYNRTDESSPKK